MSIVDMDKARSGAPEVQPLYRELPPAKPFPMDALGEFSDAAKTLQRVIQAPDAICGQSILAGLTLAAQPFADVSIDGRISPISSYFVSVAETGERKSAVDSVATWPHREHEEMSDRGRKVEQLVRVVVRHVENLGSELLTAQRERRNDVVRDHTRGVRNMDDARGSRHVAGE